MARYDYECEDCGHAFEAHQAMADAKLVDCPACQQPTLNRLPSAGAGPVFKGIFPGQDHARMRKADELIEKAKRARKMKYHQHVPMDEPIKEKDVDLTKPDDLAPIRGPRVLPGPSEPPCPEPT